MDMAMVTKDLKRRIDEGRAWVESDKGMELDGPQLRKFPTKIRLKEFLDTPKRKERYGLGFMVTVEPPEGKKLCFQLNVRIKPDLTEGKKIESVPYVVVYVVDQPSHNDDEIIHEDFYDPKYYSGLSKLASQDWYLNWISKAFRKGSGKFFSENVRIN